MRARHVFRRRHGESNILPGRRVKGWEPVVASSCDESGGKKELACVCRFAHERGDLSVGTKTFTSAVYRTKAGQFLYPASCPHRPNREAICCAPDPGGERRQEHP